MDETKPRTQHPVAVAMGILFFLGGVFGVAGSYFAYRQDREILDHGPRVEAEILGRSEVASDFMADYSFITPDGRRFASSHSFAKDAWAALKPGDRITVAYSEKNPKRNFPADGGGVTSPGVAIFVACVAGMFGIFGALLFVPIVLRKKTPQIPEDGCVKSGL